MGEGKAAGSDEESHEYLGEKQSYEEHRKLCSLMEPNIIYVEPCTTLPIVH